MIESFWLDRNERYIHVGFSCPRADYPVTRIDTADPEWSHWWRRGTTNKPENDCCDTRPRDKCMSNAVSDRVCYMCWGSPIA